MKSVSRLHVRSTLILAAALMVAAALLIPGCDSNAPEGAVNKYFKAWQGGDWEAYKASVVSQELTEEQEALAKEKFGQIKVKVEGLEMETTFDSKDKNRASVVLTDGKITYTAKILGETKTETHDLKKLEKDLRTYETVKINGVWYVNTKLG